MKRLHVEAVRRSRAQFAHRRHLDHHRGDLQQRIGLVIETAGLDVDHDGQEAPEPVGNARFDELVGIEVFGHAGSSMRHARVAPARNGTSRSFAGPKE